MTSLAGIPSLIASQQTVGSELQIAAAEAGASVEGITFRDFLLSVAPSSVEAGRDPLRSEIGVGVSPFLSQALLRLWSFDDSAGAAEGGASCEAFTADVGPPSLQPMAQNRSMAVSPDLVKPDEPRSLGHEAAAMTFAVTSAPTDAQITLTGDRGKQFADAFPILPNSLAVPRAVAGPASTERGAETSVKAASPKELPVVLTTRSGASQPVSIHLIADGGQVSVLVQAPGLSPDDVQEIEDKVCGMLREHGIEPGRVRVEAVFAEGRE
ncbi:hypothetical protein [Novosphingobium beihaiensis]|uniref:Flagellar hook-length control protein FliK n=1 Tax=Novosphingobium beihaiensis TaxID=2930389 RepID=A0ABT0BPJ6_9SPHN|nr:hypothetical protein [Novosphingobium beihaiensis]MCJ2186986.1 hypothetical protein [Novosphingobium beihaiensis]